MKSPETHKSSKAETVIVSAITIGSLSALALAGYLAAENHAASEQDKNAQWNEEAEQNDKRADFENGLNQGSVTIETPAPTVTELPVPNTH